MVDAPMTIYLKDSAIYFRDKYPAYDGLGNRAEYKIKNQIKH